MWVPLVGFIVRGGEFAGFAVGAAVLEDFDARGAAGTTPTPKAPNRHLTSGDPLQRFPHQRQSQQMCGAVKGSFIVGRGGSGGAA